MLDLLIKMAIILGIIVVGVILFYIACQVLAIVLYLLGAFIIWLTDKLRG